MAILKILGRVFYGLGIAGIGIMHFFYPGIRPIIIPHLNDNSTLLNVIGHSIGIVLILAGILIAIGKKFTTLSLLMGAAFLILFFIGHLPVFVTAGPKNSDLWVNFNKILALSGGAFLVSAINAPGAGHKLLSLLTKLAPIGSYLFAIMLYNFGTGHISMMNGISTIVPKYIPFPKFWTFMGGIALIGAAISIFSKIKTRQITLALAAVLFTWLLSLHLYYAIRFPAWQEGENFIGVFSCLAFCGTALTISQSGSGNKSTS
jgi:uncharacterized membrane protein YphA (DoxX/SURF4 family)